MAVSTIEAIVENGQIRLPASAHLPEGTKVYVVVPDVPVRSMPFRIMSPRLVHREQAADFRKTVTEE